MCNSYLCISTRARDSRWNESQTQTSGNTLKFCPHLVHTIVSAIDTTARIAPEENYGPIFSKGSITLEEAI